MENNERLIVNNYDAEAYTLCSISEIDNAIDRAKASYKRDVDIYKSHLIQYPNMADHWRAMLEKTNNILKAGFKAVTFEEYNKLQRNRWLSKEAKEITAEEFDYALNILPPKHWVRTDRYSMFFIGECLTMTYFEQYLYDKQTGKYWTATTDICDRSTWIDKLLGL